MLFKLSVNPMPETQRFIEGRIDSLREMKVKNIEEALSRLRDDVTNIFTARYDKIRKDARFMKVFMSPHLNIRKQDSKLGELLVGAYSIMDKINLDDISFGKKDKELREDKYNQYFERKLRSLEAVFGSDVEELQDLFIGLFLRYTYQTEKLEGENLVDLRKKFQNFIDDQNVLFWFFFYLDEFSRLNNKRAQKEKEKKPSLSSGLDDEIQHGTLLQDIQEQIFICKKLKHIAEKLIEISQDHNPLDGVRRVLDEVYSSSGQENLIKGLLGKFLEFHKVELEYSLKALVYKRIIHLNQGTKEGRNNRKAWLAELTPQDIEKLVSLLEVRVERDARLSPEQNAQQELFVKFRTAIDEWKEEEKKGTPLDEGDMNLLVLRLSNIAVLEQQVEAQEQEIKNYRERNKVGYQNSIIKSYNENLDRLSQSIFYYLEITFIKDSQLNMKAKQVLGEFLQKMQEMDGRLDAEMKAEFGAGDESGKSDADDREKDETGDGKPIEEGIELEPEEYAERVAKEMHKMTNSNKIKPLKELASIGFLSTLKHILPLNRYNTEFVRKLARNTAVKIILRELREDEESSRLGIQQKKKLVELVINLDQKYKHLKDLELGNPKTTGKILDILIHEDNEFSARMISEIIVDNDERIRASAVRLIADMIDTNDTSLLVKLLGDPDRRVRANVIESLEEVGNRNVLGILMKYKYDKDNRVRGNAIKAIWNFGNKDIDDSLEEMLVDPEETMRASGVWVIGEIGHNQPDLKVLLRAVAKDRSPMVQDNIEKAKKKIEKREKGFQVMIADDDSEFCRDIGRKLSADGYKFRVALNGQSALWSINKQPPDIILLDLRLPRVNGMEMLKQIRASEELCGIPVIMLCDVNSSLLIKKALEIGANSYLVKPCNYQQIKEKVAKLL